ncbi:MAG: NEW3 domain-containing protein [Actinomycetota bacterium]|nr:NEW3 domain-containing protein [Actinomycetota bacterium]
MLAGADRATAADEPFKLDFDTSELQIGALENLPLGTLSSKASITGTISDTGVVKIPAGGFKMPELGLTEPVSVKGFMGIEGPATGTFDKTTGKLEINGKAGIWLSVNVAQLLGAAEGFGLDLTGSLGSLTPFVGLIGDLTCGFSPMDITFSTEPNALSAGARFTDGPLGPGALSAEWDELGPFAGRTKVLGLIDVCAMLKNQLPALLGGLGGDSLPGGIDLGGLLENLDLTQLDNLNLGPSSITLIRTTSEDPPGPPVTDPPPGQPPLVDRAPARLRLSVTPKNRKVKPGRTVRYRAAVSNTGDTASKPVKVCVTAPKRAIRRAHTCRTLGTIEPGATRRTAFRLRPKNRAAKRSYRIGFRVRTGAPTKPKSSARLRVR